MLAIRAILGDRAMLVEHGGSTSLRVKRDLAQRTWRHVQHYADAKTDIIHQIMERACAPGRPDPG